MQLRAGCATVSWTARRSELSTPQDEQAKEGGVVEETRRYDAFLSYARIDKAFVTALARALEARDKNVYVDLDDIPPGAAWQRHVLRGIDASKVVVFVLSPESVTSDVCEQELARALAANKRIVPVLRRDVDPRALPEHLTAPNWIWLREDDDADAGHAALVAALELDEEWVDAHARLTVRAREWDEADRDASFLLRGSDLDAAEQWLAHQGEHRESATPTQVQYILESRQAASRRRRRTLGAVVGALAIAVALAVFAVVQRNEAVRQSHTAQSRELAAAANAQLDADPELSMLLAAEGARIAPTRQATAALRTALSALRLDGQTRMTFTPLGEPALSPDGRRVLQGGVDGAGRVVDVADGSVEALLRPRGLPKPQARYYDGGPDVGAAFSSDGRHVATVSFDGVARVWDWRARRIVATLPEVGKVRPAFSPDGRKLAVGAMLWDWRRDRRAQLDRAGDDAFVSRSAFDASGRYVVGFAAVGGATVWDVTSRRVVAELPAPDGDEPTVGVAFSPDGRRLARGMTDGLAEVWDWRSRRKLADLQSASGFAVTLFSADGTSVLVADGDDKIRIWDWEAGTVAGELRGHRGRVLGIALAPDGRIVSSGSDRTIRRWRLPSRGRTLASTARRFVGSVDLGSDGRLVVAGGPSYPHGFGAPRRAAEVFDARTGRRLGAASEAPVDVGDYEPWLRVALSPDGRSVAGASDSGVVRVWDWRGGRELAALRHGRRFVGDVAFHPDGELVATTTNDRGVYVWSWRDRRVVRRLAPAPDPPDFPGDIAFDPSGEVLAVVEGAQVRVQDWRGKRVLATLPLPANAEDVSFDRTGRLVAVAGADGVARVVDWRSGEAIAELLGGGRVTTVSFSRDGDLLLTGDPHVATVWDWRLEQRILDLPAPSHKPTPQDSVVGEARFSADAKRIAVADNDNRARVYDCEACAPLSVLLTLADRRATRELTAAERRRHLG